MARITIQLQTVLKNKFGRETVKAEAATVAEALKALEAELGPAFRREAYENGKIKSHFIFILNGEIIDTKSLETAKLADGDMLGIFVPVGGG